MRSSVGATAGVNSRIQGAFQDITIRKAGEQELARMNRALKTLSSCSEALIWAENEKGLLDDICRIAIEHGGYRMAWVGFAEDDEFRSITPVAHRGVEEGYLSEIKVTWDENEPSGRGMAGKVIRSGKAAICEDISNDPTFSHWLPVALRHGYRSAVVLPLRDGSRTFGCWRFIPRSRNRPAARSSNFSRNWRMTWPLASSTCGRGPTSCAWRTLS